MGSDYREVKISRLQCDPFSWPIAADTTNAKIVVTRGPDGIDALNSKDFMLGDFYRAAIHTHENFEYIGGLIGGPLGIVVHKDAVQELKQTANRKDHLGRRILAL